MSSNQSQKSKTVLETILNYMDFKFRSDVLNCNLCVYNYKE